MSRSIKKFPAITDWSKHETRKSKRRASKKVRRADDFALDGGKYKHIFCSYDIFDIKQVEFDYKKTLQCSPLVDEDEIAPRFSLEKSMRRWKRK